MAESSETANIEFKDQLASSSRLLKLQHHNCIADLNASDYPEQIRPMVECLRSSVLATAMTAAKAVPLNVLSLAYSTARFDSVENTMTFELSTGIKTTITMMGFLHLLGLNSTSEMVDPTSILAEDMINMFNQMGHTPLMTRLSQFKKPKLPNQWSLMFTIFLRSLAERITGQDSASKFFLSLMFGIYTGINLDYGKVIWTQFTESITSSTKDTEISCPRFWSLVVYAAYKAKKIQFDETAKVIDLPKFNAPSRWGDQSQFDFIGDIPEEMLSKVSQDNVIIQEYRKTLVVPRLVRNIPADVMAKISSVSHTRKQGGKRKGSSEVSQSESVPKIKKAKVSEALKETHISQESFSEAQTVTEPQVSIPLSSQDADISLPQPSSPIQTSADNIFQHPLNNPLISLSLTPPASLPSASETLKTIFGDAEPSPNEPTGLDDIAEEDELAPFGIDEEEEDSEADSGVLMTKREYRSLNRKLIVLLQKADKPINDQILKSLEAQAAVLKNNEEKMVALQKSIREDNDDNFDSIMERWREYEEKIQKQNQSLCAELATVKANVKSLSDQLTAKTQVLSEKDEEIVKLKNKQEDLQKLVNEGVEKIKLLEAQAAWPNPSEILDIHGRKVDDKINEMFQKLSSQIAPIEKMLGLRTKASVPKSQPFSSQQGGEQVPFSSQSVPSSSQSIPPSSESIPKTSKTIEKTISIGGPTRTIPIFSTATTMTSERLDKGKRKMADVDAETLEKQTKFLQELSMIREKKQVQESLKFIFEDWDEKLIRERAFGKSVQFLFIPRASFSTVNTVDDQMDLPMTPKAFHYRCFSLYSGFKPTIKEYNELLIKFYSSFAKPAYEVWSSKKIVKVLDIVSTGWFENKLFNITFKVIRGSDSELIEYSLADLPLMNPHDWISLMFLLVDKDRKRYAALIYHIKTMLIGYFFDIAERDFEVAKYLNKTITAPDTKMSNIQKIKEGKISNEPWGIVFSKKVRGVFTKNFLKIEEKEKFASQTLLSMAERIKIVESNKKQLIIDTENMLLWWVAVRKILLDAAPEMFSKE